MSPSTVTDDRTTYAALAHRFLVRCNDDELAIALADALSALRTDEPGPPATVYELLVDDSGSNWSLSVDGTPVGPSLHHPRYQVEHLMWTINRSAADETPGLVLMHAAVAERDGSAVVFPASMEAGKTTLVTALVRAGFRYLSDEIAALDPHTGQLIAYPKPLSLDPGSWPLFPDLAPATAASAMDRQWLVSPDRVRAGSVVPTARPVVLVAPTYRPGADGRAHPLDRVSALRLLVAQTFRFRRAPQRDLEALADLVRSVPCHRLEVDDLDDACATIEALLRDVHHPDHEVAT